MSGPDTEFNRMCRQLGGVTEILPGSLSEAARKEINEACGKLAENAKQKGKDLEHLVRGDLGKISEDTWKELATLAKDLGQSPAAHQTPAWRQPVSPPTISDVSSLTKGEGERLKISLPFKFSSHTDVYLMLNYDQQALLRNLDVQINGAGAGLKTEFSKNIKLTSEIFVDTSNKSLEKSGFIKLEVRF